MDSSPKSPPRILIYILRRDLRLHDNPILATEVAKAFSSDSPGTKYTHLLPIYVFPAQHVEVSGLLRKSTEEEHVKNPYPPARSQVGGFWRCGPHRAKFLTESVWDLKKSLKDVGSDLIIRAGLVEDVVGDALDWLSSKNEKESSSDGAPKIAGVWMTKDESVEEKREERSLRQLLEKRGIDFETFQDEKYYVDE